MIVLHEHDRRRVLHLFDHRIRKAAVDPHVLLPVGFGKLGSRVGDMTERPQRVVGEAVVVALLFLRREPDAAQHVGRFVGRYFDAAAGIGRLAIGVAAATLEIRRAEDIAPAFEELKGHAEALYVCIDTVLFGSRVRISTLAVGARLPTMVSNREFVEAGGLMSYGPNFPDLFRRAGDYVDKILRSAKAADIPVEQPTLIELSINMQTARALGIVIPDALLARAERVIE